MSEEHPTRGGGEGRALCGLPPEDLPKVEDLVTEDDAPVDNIFSEKEQRLLVEPLYASWKGPEDGRPFLALSNVGFFFSINKPPFVPDMMLSLGVQAPPGDVLWVKSNRSYFLWEYGKPPDVIIEVVSNVEGEERGKKLREYAQLGVTYYVIFDPQRKIQEREFCVHVLAYGSYRELDEPWLPSVGLGLGLWEGPFEGTTCEWLRWYDRDGQVVPTGAERAEQESRRAEQEHRRAERLAARLRELGIDPNGES